MVYDKSYLKSFAGWYNNLVEDSDKLKALDNLMIWSFVKGRSNFLPKVYRDIQQDFDKVSSGTNVIPPRTRTCANAITDRMSYAVGRLYVEKNFDEKSKKAAFEMIENIRAEFISMLKDNNWMDTESKQKAKEKAEYIDVKVGYPDYTYNNTYLDSLYENVREPNINYLNLFQMFHF